MQCGCCNQNGSLYSWGAYFCVGAYYPDFMVCVHRFVLVHMHNSPLAEVVSSNENSEQLPVILNVNLASLETPLRCDD